MRELRRARAGIAGLEFALIAPTMIILFFGCVELTNLFRMQAKLALTAGQLAELIAGQQSVTLGAQSSQTGALADTCAGAAMNMLPYPNTSIQASIGSFTVASVAGSLRPVTDWTTDTACGATSVHAGQATLSAIADSPFSLFTRDGTPYASGGAAVNGYSAIAVQVVYRYSNVAAFFLGTTLTFTATAAARPRSNTTIACTTLVAGNSTACPQNP